MTFGAVITRAYEETLNAMGGRSFLLTLLASPFLGFAIHLLSSGYDKVMEEIHLWLIYGLAATGALWSFLFLFNLNMAPYRIERDRRILLEGELRKIPTSVMPDTRLKDLEFDEAQLRKLTDLASIGAVKIWGRGDGTGVIGYPTQENQGDRRKRTIERIRLCETCESSILRELDREIWQNWLITRKIKSSLHPEIDLFEEGINAIADNKHVGLGSAIFDLMVNSKQIYYEMGKSKI